MRELERDRRIPVGQGACQRVINVLRSAGNIEVMRRRLTPHDRISRSVGKVRLALVVGDVYKRQPLDIAGSAAVMDDAAYQDRRGIILDRLAQSALNRGA